MSWSDLTEWWLAELAVDPAYEKVITPLLVDLLEPETGARYLDVGSGEGRVMRSVQRLGASVDGVDVNPDFAARGASVAVADVAHLPIRDHAYDGVYCVLALEHVADVDKFFEECARVAKAGGVLALVINHPVWTAPDATPISDQYGEVLWRPGDYFGRGWTEMPAGDSKVVFHHRSMGDLLTSAASAGWALERMVEQPHHEFDDQSGIPRLLGCRWTMF